MGRGYCEMSVNKHKKNLKKRRKMTINVKYVNKYIVSCFILDN